MTKMIVITAIPQCTNAGGIVPMMLRTFSERSSIRSLLLFFFCFHVNYLIPIGFLLNYNMPPVSL